MVNNLLHYVPNGTDGPMVIVHKTPNGAHRLAKLDGAVFNLCLSTFPLYASRPINHIFRPIFLVHRCLLTLKIPRWGRST